MKVEVKQIKTLCPEHKRYEKYVGNYSACPWYCYGGSDLVCKKCQGPVTGNEIDGWECSNCK